MPRLTAIKAEIGTSGDIRTFRLTGNAHIDVLDATHEEHPCDDPSCDIGVALDNGYGMSAAYLLIGATETPLLERVLDHYAVDFSEFPDDWDEWVAHHKKYGRCCPSCNSYTYADDYWEPTECGNCLASLPDPPCPDCDGLGFQAGAHTERVVGCPTCSDEEDDDE